MLLRLKNEIVYPGVEIHAVTQGDAIVSNIYCERPFSSADGESFLFFRQTDRSSPGDWPVW
ncbi:MAG: hypothetical protein K9N49_02030, partial [Candidatus Marinimicrobia bacterium]|nr:hypothetical protein [Candidatus Neomarinimicrobiota bacterium]